MTAKKKQQAQEQEELNQQQTNNTAAADTMEQEATEAPVQEPQNTDATPEPASAITEQVKELESKFNDINDKYLRLYSEFDNYRKRTAKEKSEIIKTASENIIVSLLPIIDDFERATKAFQEKEDVPAFKEGVELIFSKFMKTLTQKGLAPIDAIGTTFDTDLHEAITNIPAPSKKMKGKVVDDIEKGYTLNGKVIRFSKVVVGK